MKAGDMIKRCDTFKEWMKHNSWMSLEEEQEIGLITKICGDHLVVVLWAVTGLSWEHEDDIEVLPGMQNNAGSGII